MTIFSSFSANFPPHYHTILTINCVHASNWFTHLQLMDNSVLTVWTSKVPMDKSNRKGILLSCLLTVLPQKCCVHSKLPRVYDMLGMLAMMSSHIVDKMLLPSMNKPRQLLNKTSSCWNQLYTQGYIFTSSTGNFKVGGARGDIIIESQKLAQ